jgi:hypothetical protein
MFFTATGDFYKSRKNFSFAFAAGHAETPGEEKTGYSAQSTGG